MDINVEQRNAFLALGVLAGAGAIIAFIQTWKWFVRSGKEIIDLATLGKLVFYAFGAVSTAILLVLAGVSVWWMLIYKKRYEENFAVDISSFGNLFRIFLVVAFVLKTLDIVHLIVRQANIDIFFMDWERSKTGDLTSVSVWRTYFVANEFNEIQTHRRINVPFQLFFVLLLLKVVHLEDVSCTQSQFTAFAPETNCTEYNQILRTGIGFSTFLGTALLQYLAYTIFYQRIITDRIVNFIDLCSVSNISVFILDQNQHGYYIHGRSPHGRTDVNLKEVLMNLHREENQMIGTRGLQNNATEQVFIMKINQSFRKQYDLFFRIYYNYNGPRKTREDAERYTDMLLQSYQNMNGFLCAFIDHSLASQKYSIRNRYFLERILNYEFQSRASFNADGSIDNTFYIDNERSFSAVLFYGVERSLFVWNAITFLFVDYLATDFVLAAMITYILNAIVVGVRDSFGRRNLSRKTLIPRSFLI